MDNISIDLEGAWDQIRDYLPQVLGAIGLAILGLVLARIVSEFLRKRIDNSSIGAAANRDALGPGNPSLGRSLGSAVFWIIVLLTIPPVLITLGLNEALVPLNSMLETVMTYLPHVAGAAAIVIIGFIIATVARRAVTSLLSAAPIDHAARQAEIGDLIKGTEIARAAGLIVYVLILIPIFIAGLEALAIN